MEKLQKIIANYGTVSRRAAEKLIEEGRVTVNGATAHIGDRADGAADEIRIDGELLAVQPEKVYIMLNKPEGYVSSVTDDRGRHPVTELTADVGVRVYPVGRLDIATRGLLLMTNDGDFTYRLTHPSFEKNKVYHALVAGNIDVCSERLRTMDELDGESIVPPEVSIFSRNTQGGVLEITIHEGKNRQVRRMCEAAGLNVIKLERTAEGGLTLGDLPEGHWRYLTEDEVRELMQ